MLSSKNDLILYLQIFEFKALQRLTGSPPHRPSSQSRMLFRPSELLIPFSFDRMVSLGLNAIYTSFIRLMRRCSSFLLVSVASFYLQPDWPWSFAWYLQIFEAAQRQACSNGISSIGFTGECFCQCSSEHFWHRGQKQVLLMQRNLKVQSLCVGQTFSSPQQVHIFDLMIDFDIKVAKIRQFLKTGGAADMAYREEEKIIEEAQKNQSKQKDIFKSLYKSIDSQKKFGKAKRLILENYQKLEEAYLIWIQAIQKVSQSLTNPNILRQGKNTLNEVFAKVSYNEPNYSECIDRLMIPKLVDKPNLQKYSKQILDRKKKLLQSASALPEIKTKKSFKPLRQRQQSSQSPQKVQKQKHEKEEKKAKVEKDKPERNINSLLQKKIKETAATYGLASVEAGYYNLFNQLFNKFITNLLQKLIRYSSIQNEGHPHLGSEFKLFEKKGELPQAISWLIPFNNSYTDPFSMSTTKKRRVIELYKTPVFNPLEQYTKLLEQDMKFQSTAVRQLAEDVVKARDKRDIQKDVLQTLLYESKGLTAQSYKLYQEAQSLREHGQKPQSKRLTLRLAGVQCWLQESGMSHLLEKSYLK